MPGVPEARRTRPYAGARREGGGAGAQRSRGHLRRGCAATSPATDWAAQDLQGGVRPRFGTPVGFPAYSPGLARMPGPFGAGAGRSVQGLPILWEPPSPGDLRGHTPVGAAPGGDSGEGGARQEEGEPAGR